VALFWSALYRRKLDHANQQVQSEADGLASLAYSHTVGQYQSEPEMNKSFVIFIFACCVAGFTTATYQFLQIGNATDLDDQSDWERYLLAAMIISGLLSALCVWPLVRVFKKQKSANAWFDNNPRDLEREPTWALYLAIPIIFLGMLGFVLLCAHWAYEERSDGGAFTRFAMRSSVPLFLMIYVPYQCWKIIGKRRSGKP
jgi:hypothetical protein